MCHSTVFWYLCNHLVFNETKCPFEGTLPSHSKDFTTAAFTDHPCCLCQQPASPAIEALRANQLTPSQLQPIFGIDVNDTRFPWCVAEFFARGEHLRYKQPGPRFRRGSGAGAGAASASASASRTSSFSSGSSGRGTRASSVSKAKQSPAIKDKKSPPMPRAKQSSSPPTKEDNPTKQPTPQIKQSMIPQPMQKSMPPPMPQPTTQSLPQAVPAAIPISEDDFLAEALKDWERGMSAPDSDFTKVDFEAIKHLHELEELSGLLPQGSQTDPESHTTQSVSSTQNDTQSHDNVQSQAQPQVQRKQEPTPYDGTNWGQEGVYLPRENYYFAGEKSSSVVNAQMPSSLLGPDGHPARLHAEMERSFLELTNIDACCDGRQKKNSQQSLCSLNQSFSEAPVANHMQQQGNVSAGHNANASIKHSLPQQQNESPIAQLSPKEIHQFAAPSTKNKTKNSKSKPKPKTSPTPTVTIIDEYRSSCAGIEIENPINIKRASKSTATKDPTRGIKDSSSRVTKPSSTSSASTSVSSASTTHKSSGSNKSTMENATAQQQKRQRWTNTPETVPSTSSDLMNYTTSNASANANANGNSAMTLCF